MKSKTSQILDLICYYEDQLEARIQILDEREAQLQAHGLVSDVRWTDAGYNQALRTVQIGSSTSDLHGSRYPAHVIEPCVPLAGDPVWDLAEIEKHG